MMNKFRELLKVSMKSEDTEEWLDVYFTRPVGLAFALLWNRLNIHPNVITILSIFLGVAAGWMFHYTDLWSNVLGVALLVTANFCDSTDGQMARLTGKKTLIGRMLDGFSGDAWFFCIYVGIVVRLWPQMIPCTQVSWGIWIFLLACAAGFLSHSPQCSLADYYRQIHLFFLLGKEGSELDNYRQQRAHYESLSKNDWVGRAFFFFYSAYCKSQEQRTPQFQKFFSKWQLQETPNEQIRLDFLKGSRPLMMYANLLTFNTRAICLYVTALLDCPWLYLLFEIIVLNSLYVYMHRSHERLCQRLCEQWGTEE
jgi:hypothetical protein